MSFWSNSLSSKWAEDVAVSSDQNRDKPGRADIQLPLPVVTRLPSAKEVRTRRSTGSAWRRFRKGVQDTLAAPPANSELCDDLESRDGHEMQSKAVPSKEKDDSDEVDEVVVDRSWFEEQKTSPFSDGGASESTDSLTIGDHAEWDSPIHAPQGFWAWCRLLSAIRYKLWPFLVRFFDPHFEDPKIEALYQREVWSQAKRLALWASLFFLANWILAVIFIPRPTVLADQVCLYPSAVLSVLSHLGPRYIITQ